MLFSRCLFEFKPYCLNIELCTFLVLLKAKLSTKKKLFIDNSTFFGNFK